jgi:N-acetyl-anhydromuramyl-L-alanine amidase AmpD
MKLNKIAFPEGQYLKEAAEKRQIVLHHTVSSNAASSIAWWKQTPERVAVAFVVEKDGTIFQLYEPQYWAYHIGKGSTSDQNRHTIGIEIVNEGILQANFTPQSMYKWCDGKDFFTGKTFTLSAPWRGSRYFACYTEEQYTAVGELVKYLSQRFPIPLMVNDSFTYDPANFAFHGVVSHHNLRTDKTDLSPAWDFKKFKELLT